MAVPSISVQRGWKVFTMRSFCSAEEMNWSPLTILPSKKLMPETASRMEFRRDHDISYIDIGTQGTGDTGVDQMSDVKAVD